MVSDRHWFQADPDSAFFFIANPNLRIKVGLFCEFNTIFFRELFYVIFFFSYHYSCYLEGLFKIIIIFSWGKMSKRKFLQIQKKSSKFKWNLNTWIRIWIRILKADPDPAAQIIADPIRNGSTFWKRIWIQQLKLVRFRIRDPVPFWPLDPGWGKSKDPDPGWTTRNIPRA